MISNALTAQQRLNRSEPLKPTRQRQCAEIALWRWSEYFQRPQCISKALDFIQQIGGDDGVQMGNRMLSVQSHETDSAHHRKGTILR
jgi:hypothetical protein